MKTSNFILILIGIVGLTTMAVATKKQSRTATQPTPRNTKTFTPRIVDNEDGTFTVQYYFPEQPWHRDPNAYRVTLEKAREAALRKWQLATNTADAEKIVK